MRSLYSVGIFAFAEHEHGLIEIAKPEGHGRRTADGPAVPGEMAEFGLMLERGVDRPPAGFDPLALARGNRTQHELHRPALQFRAAKSIVVMPDHPVLVRPAPARVFEQFGRNLFQNRQLLGGKRSRKKDEKQQVLTIPKMHISFPGLCIGERVRFASSTVKNSS